jgi:hypothetical protein
VAVNIMPITIKVTPDMSAFRQVTPEEIAQLLQDHMFCDAETIGMDIGRLLLGRFTVMPK